MKAQNQTDFTQSHGGTKKVKNKKIFMVYPKDFSFLILVFFVSLWLRVKLFLFWLV
jgi:hypothetical protein